MTASSYSTAWSYWVGQSFKDKNSPSQNLGLYFLFSPNRLADQEHSDLTVLQNCVNFTYQSFPIQNKSQFKEITNSVMSYLNANNELITFHMQTLIPIQHSIGISK